MRRLSEVCAHPIPRRLAVGRPPRGDERAVRHRQESTSRVVAVLPAGYDSEEPVNLGRGEEVWIKDLTDLIAARSGFEGEIVWDATKPNGQPRRRLGVSRAERQFGFRAGTAFEQGLARTID